MSLTHTITDSLSPTHCAHSLINNLLHIINHSPQTKLIHCDCSQPENIALFKVYSQLVSVIQQNIHQSPSFKQQNSDHASIKIQNLIELTNLPFTSSLKLEITNILNKYSLPTHKKTYLLQYFHNTIKNANLISTLETITKSEPIAHIKGDLSQKIEVLRERCIAWENIVDQINKYEVTQKDRLEMPPAFKSLRPTDQPFKKIMKLGQIIKIIKIVDEKLVSFRQQVRAYKNGQIFSLQERLLRPLQRMIKQNDNKTKLYETINQQNKSFTSILQSLSKLNFPAYEQQIRSVQRSAQSPLNSIKEELQSAANKSSRLSYKLEEIVKVINPSYSVSSIQRTVSASQLLEELADKQVPQLEKLVSTLMHFIEEMRELSLFKEANKNRSQFRSQLELKSELKEYLSIIRRMKGNRFSDSGITQVTQSNNNNSFIILPEEDTSKQYDAEEAKGSKANWNEVCQLLTDKQNMHRTLTNSAEYDQEYHDFRSRKEDMIKELRQLTAQLQQRDNQIREMKNSTANINPQTIKEMSQSSVRAETLEMTVGQLRRTLQDLQRENKQMSSQINWIYNEHEVEINRIVENLKKQLATERSKSQSLTTKLKNLRQQNQQLTNQITLLRNLESQLKKMEVKYKDLENSYNYVKKEKEEAHNQIGKLKQQHQRQIQMLQKTHKDTEKQMNEQISAAQSDLQRATTEYEQFVKQYIQLQSNCQNLQVRIEQMDKQLRETDQQLTAKTNIEEQYVLQINQLIQTNNKLNFQLSASAQQIRKQKSKIDVQTNKIKQLEKQRLQTISLKNGLKSSKKSNEQQKDIQKQKSTHTTPITQQMSFSNQQIQTLRFELSEATSQNNRIKADLQQTINICDLLNNEQNRALMLITDLQLKIDRFQQKDCFITQTLAQKSDHIRAINRNGQNLNHLHNRLDRINSCLLSVQDAAIVQLTTEINQLKQLNEYLANKLISEQSKAKATPQNKQNSKLSEQPKQKVVSELQQNTDNCKTQCNPTNPNLKMPKAEPKVIHSENSVKISSQYRQLALVYGMDVSRITQCQKSFCAELLKNRIDYKIQLIRHLQKWRGLTLSKTKFMFFYQSQASKNTHPYIDKRHNLLYIVKSLKNQYLACHFSGVYSSIDTSTKPALVISLITDQSFEMGHSAIARHKTLRGMTEDDFLYFFSNCQIKNAQPNLFKQFEEDTPTFKPPCRLVKDLIEADDLLECYQIHQVFYSTQ